MGYPCTTSILVPKLMYITFQYILSSIFKGVLIILTSTCISLTKYTFSSSDKAHHEEEEEEYSSSDPSLVPVPFPFIVESLKKRLPIVEFCCFIGKRAVGSKSNINNVKLVCVVCLRRMKGGDEVRELCNCDHVFHRECTDAWIDEGHITCPLCKSKLLQDHHHQGERCRGDPWRRERMIYLFGEDSDMFTF